MADSSEQKNNISKEKSNKPLTSVICFNSGSNLSNKTYQLNGKQDIIEKHSQSLILENGVIENLSVKLTSAPGVGNSRTFTVRVNGVDTALSVVISDNNTTGSNKTSILNVNEFDLISLLHTSTGSNIVSSVGIVGLKYKSN